VRIGGTSKAELLRALREAGVQLNEAAEALFADERFVTSVEPRDVDVETLTVGDLGFPDGATHAQLLARARARGLDEAPLELGPRWRLQLVDQPEGAFGAPLVHGRAPTGSITVVSTLLDARDETPKGFYLRRVDGVLWLRGYWSGSDHLWSAADVLAFARTPSTS
jgi:hypothetical protein